MDFNNFKWLNESSFTISADKLEIKATPYSDYSSNKQYNSTSEVYLVNNAPFYFKETDENFVFTSKVSFDYKKTFDACAIMVMDNDKHYAKLCFERTNFKTNAVVSVVNMEVSDDCNGPCINNDYVYLRIIRNKTSFAFHFSPDGKTYYCHRLFSLPIKSKIKVGFVAQAPIGDGGIRTFEDSTLEYKTVEDLREGK